MATSYARNSCSALMFFDVGIGFKEGGQKPVNGYKKRDAAKASASICVADAPRRPLRLGVKSLARDDFPIACQHKNPPETCGQVPFFLLCLPWGVEHGCSHGFGSLVFHREFYKAVHHAKARKGEPCLRVGFPFQEKTTSGISPRLLGLSGPRNSEFPPRFTPRQWCFAKNLFEEYP